MDYSATPNPPRYEELSKESDYSRTPSAPVNNQFNQGFQGSQTMLHGQPGMMPYHPQYIQNYPIIQQPAAAPVIIQVNNSGPRGTCAACNTGVLRGHFSCCAICCCIVFFPLGIICCLCMRGRKCSHCGVVY